MALFRLYISSTVSSVWQNMGYFFTVDFCRP